MEATDEPPVNNSTTDLVKVNTVNDDTSLILCEENERLKPNGVTESIGADQPDSNIVVTTETVMTDITTEPESENNCDVISEVPASTAADSVVSPVLETEVITTIESVPATDTDSQVDENNPSNTADEITEVIIDESDKIHCNENEILIEHTTEVIDNTASLNDKVTFTTEILVEKHDNDLNENELNETVTDKLDATNNILNEFGQSIELSEVLQHSSDVAENVENNNCTLRQEVFNKEELLDILEGNDIEPSSNEITEVIELDPIASKNLEAQLALQQLSRLKTKRGRKNKNVEEIPRTRKVDKMQIKKKENIINVLVKDWDDDENLEQDQPVKILKGENKISDQSVERQETVINQEETLTSMDTSISHTSDEQTPNLSKSGDEGHKHRRLGRVIKKKVIFDPDNPDTFTKGKTATKNKEPHIKEEEQPPSKKGKADLSPQKKSKLPTNKIQWKKPSPKNSKQNKRLTEVDKLLMDEGAVNMIYQLTPEAHKGKKNMKTKAELIKKIQSSTPDSKEMKFRERKKEAKSEEGDAKKILSGKHRTSLSSSVKSPSVSEDFETHSADDSIIYRRHSSSSYSSTCMSPRRLSDVEVGAPRVSQQITDNQSQANVDSEDGIVTDVFMSDNLNTTSTEIINKNDYLSIKEKLNSKLSLVLNKRKRENTKIDKPMKQKKIPKTKEKDESTLKNDIPNFTFLTISFHDRLVEINIQNTGSSCNIQTLKELEQALLYVDSKKDISVTLLTSECGALLSSLDLSPLLDDNMEKRTNYAHKIAESVRSLLCAVAQHSKLVCTGVRGACSGVALAVLALSDVSVASERATFSLGADHRAPLQPGVAVFTSQCRPLPHLLVNDLVVFGRQLSAAEALRGGLVSRTLWPDRFLDQLRALARDLAAQPAHNLLLKKQLLNFKKGGESSTLLSCLETERDLLAEYWTSVEGQELLRATLHPA